MNTHKSNWITIPEDALHTPASARPKDEETPTVKNKLLWGVGFVLMVVVAAALLAPQEMKNLLQGNLFEVVPTDISQTADTNAFGLKPLNLLPAQTAEEKADESKVADSSQPASPVEEPQPVAETPDVQSSEVVQAETAPMAVEVEPVSPAPSIVTPTPPAQSVVSVSQDGNAKMIADLQKQLTEIQKQREEDAAKIKDLTDQIQLGGLHAAAEQTLGITAWGADTNVPRFIQATEQLGQENLLQPRYRLNTHKAALTPQMILQQNLGGATVGTSDFPAGRFTQQQLLYQADMMRPGKTPDSGPSEVILISLSLLFAATVVWKGLRIFA